MKFVRSVSCLSLFLFITTTACTTSRIFVSSLHDGWEELRPPPISDLSYRIFLFGDAGRPSLEDTEPTLKLLHNQLEAQGENGTVVFLGDNIYCCGLSDSSSARRRLDEQRLLEQLQAVEDFEGQIVFIPGNHDWDDDRSGGLENLARQEVFVETYLDRGNVFLPDNGYPGPVEVDLTDRITLVIVDTQWWLSDSGKPYGDTGDYTVEEEGDFLLQLDDVVQRNDDKLLLVVGHHPLFSNGRHAGYMSLQHHLFPLTAKYDNVYLPLPLLGSLYPLYIRFFGGKQDLAHLQYQTLRKGMTGIFDQHERLVYASGHDHSLQYFNNDFQHYITSGSGSSSDYVAAGRGATFTSTRKGFVSLQYYTDGSVWMEAWEAVGEGNTGNVLFRTQLSVPSAEDIDAELSEDALDAYPDYRDSTKIIAANPAYRARPLKRLVFGRQNREVWAIPVEVPYLDMGRDAGGLTPVKRGGGMQTLSLRLQGEDGDEYVLRSIDKDPSGTVPKVLQGTVATDIVQDLISSIHPYGAFVIPKMADAVGVFHTIPHLVYVPDDPRLGVYRETFGGQLMMFEQRPDDDMTDHPEYGNSDKVISAQKLYQEINDDNDHRVDQHAFMRARLFDMFLSDWDRHRDQWRWASFESEDGEGKIYRPIPRDRDWAFNRMNGLIPKLAALVMPKFQEFSDSYGFLQGLTENGLEQDRRLTNALSRDEWVKAALEIEEALTDEVIGLAIADWPEAVRQHHGDEVIRILKVRRNKLPHVAEEVYELYARVVDIVGSNKHERFEVTRHEGGQTDVVVCKTNKDGEIRKEIYRRMFFPDETREIRLYGLDGRDRINVTGSGNDGILVTAVGGLGDDTFVDDSQVASLRKRIRFYDSTSGNSTESDGEAKIVLADDPLVNKYDSHMYQHDDTVPTTFFGSNQDDGIFLGGGVTFVRHGFRKVPYGTSQTVKANFAARTQAFNLAYHGHFVSVFNQWNLILETDYRSPTNIRNYYGLGNETENEPVHAAYYQANLTGFNFRSLIERDLEEGVTLSFGPTVEITQVEEDATKYIVVPQAGVSENTFADQWFAGVNVGLEMQSLDDNVNPRQGFRWNTTADAKLGIRNAIDHYGQIQSDLSIFFSPSLSPQVTLAIRLGGAHNIGDFPFYDANTLGGRANLRGFRGTRYAGRSSIYQNIDLRFKLLNVSTYVAIGELGVLGFFDNGRVWTDDESSRQWHQGYGGGLWLNLFDQFVLTGTMDSSSEERTFTLSFGFMY